MTKTDFFTHDERIANALLIHSSALEDPGLFHGKMGIAVYYYLLSGKKKNFFYEEIADTLIDEIIEKISHVTPLGFGNGLMGIGWGISFLVRDNFIEGNVNEILADIDLKVIKDYTNILQGESLALDDGLAGLMFYLITRIRDLEQNDYYQFTFFFKDALIKCVYEFCKRFTNLKDWVKEEDRPSLDWKYPLYIYLFSEVLSLNLLSHKVGILLKQLIEPLKNGIYPQNLFNSFVLSLALAYAETNLGPIGYEKAIKNYLGNIKGRIDSIDSFNEILNKNHKPFGYYLLIGLLKNSHVDYALKELANKQIEYILSEDNEVFKLAGFDVSSNEIGLWNGLAGLGVANVFTIKPPLADI
jgi:hypothetical protein